MIIYATSISFGGFFNSFSNEDKHSSNNPNKMFSNEFLQQNQFG
jgi:hypothetical protein